MTFSLFMNLHKCVCLLRAWIFILCFIDLQNEIDFFVVDTICLGCLCLGATAKQSCFSYSKQNSERCERASYGQTWGCWSTWFYCRYFPFWTITIWLLLTPLTLTCLAAIRWTEHRIATRILKGPWADCFTKLWSCIEHAWIWKLRQIIRGNYFDLRLFAHIVFPWVNLWWHISKHVFAVLFHSRPTCSLRMLKDHNHSSIIYQRRNTNYNNFLQCARLLSWGKSLLSM